MYLPYSVIYVFVDYYVFILLILTHSMCMFFRGPLTSMKAGENIVFNWPEKDSEVSILFIQQISQG